MTRPSRRALYGCDTAMRVRNSRIPLTPRKRKPMQSDTPHGYYRPHIDGLRALAVLAVMLYHLNPQWLPGGYTGVDLFFVISGYVVTASLAGRPTGHFVTFMGGFYARRLTRIAPALLVLLLVTTLATVLLLPQAWLSGHTDNTARAAFFGVSNILLAGHSEVYFSPRAEYNPFTHTWSLGVEEQFYLIAPLVLFAWIWGRQQHRPSVARWALVGMAALAASSLAYLALAHAGAPLKAFYLLTARFWQLAAGALLFQMALYTTPPRWVQYGSALAGVAALAASYAWLKPTAFPWPGALLPVAAALLLIGVGNTSQDAIRRALAHPIMVAIGLRSYSLYLWHWPIFVLLRWSVGLEATRTVITAVVLTAGFAELSYRFIERPLRESAAWGRRAAWQRNAMLLCAAGAAVLAAHLLIEARPTISLSTVNRNVHEWHAGTTMTGMDSGRRCEVDIRWRHLNETTIGEYHPARCDGKAHEPLAAPQIFVLGDSHAAAYRMMFDQLAAELGVSVHVYQMPSCPFLDLRMPSALERSPACAAAPVSWQADVLARAKPGDLLFAPSLRLTRLSDQWVRFDAATAREMMVGDSWQAHRNSALAEAKVALAPYLAHGMQVLFEYPKPIFASPPMRCADAFNRHHPLCEGGTQIPRAEIESLRREVVKAIDLLRAMHAGVHAWDPLPSLCDAKACAAIVGGVPRFFDGDHVSAAGNRLLYPHFKTATCKHLPTLVQCRPATPQLGP